MKEAFAKYMRYAWEELRMSLGRWVHTRGTSFWISSTNIGTLVLSYHVGSMSTPCSHANIVFMLFPDVVLCLMDRIFASIKIVHVLFLLCVISAFRWFGKGKTKRWNKLQTSMLKASLKIRTELVIAVSVEGGISLSPNTALIEGIPMYLFNLAPSDVKLDACNLEHFKNSDMARKRKLFEEQIPLARVKRASSVWIKCSESCKAVKHYEIRSLVSEQVTPNMQKHHL